MSRETLCCNTIDRVARMRKMFFVEHQHRSNHILTMRRRLYNIVVLVDTNMLRPAVHGELAA